ncbi:MAG: hypothetical protein KF895_02955 [Parvibaculum sp.]|nr:hypothetical protein [Parvibaculum sp.]
MTMYHSAIMWVPAEHRLAVNAILTAIFGELTTVNGGRFWVGGPNDTQPEDFTVSAGQRWVDGEHLEPLQQTMAALIEADELQPTGGWSAAGLTKQQALDAAAAFQILVASTSTGMDHTVASANRTAWLAANSLRLWVDPDD